MLRTCYTLLAVLLTIAACAQTDSLIVGDLQRTYTLRLPSSYDGTPLPLVIAMHGGFGSGLQLEGQSGLTAKADEEGFAVVYPDGHPSPINIRTWNAGGCCGYAMNNNIDDVGFINALLDTLITSFAIDTQRIYATGMSNGGFMSYRLACELSDRIAAIAPVSASMTIAMCEPARPVPVLAMHSYLDTSVPYLGGVGDGVSDHYNSPQDSVATAFALHADCAVLNDTIQNDAELTVVRWHECDCQKEMLLYMTHDGGHSWPGGVQTGGIGDPPSQVIDANDLMWDFFQQYTLECTSTGLGSTTRSSALVAPNPTDGTLTVQGVAIKTVRVTNAEGRVVLTRVLKGSKSTTLGVSQLPAGIYLLHITDALGERTARFVRSAR